MRKYNSKTKKTIIIILVLFVVFIVIFSLFLKKAIEVSKTAYEVEIGSILYDADQNKITTTTEATIKIKWGGNYYLKYNDENYNLGTHVVVYRSSNGDIALYGKYYEVNSDGKVNVKENENIIKSSVNSSFYKLADRKYLIIDRTIQSNDGEFVTSNYLMVNLDKSGNATLINDKTSLKTIKPTILKTSSYTFDIANELLNFGKEDIDLKKIIGSTNEYDPDTYNLNATKNEDDNNDDTEGTGSGNGTGTGDGTSGNSTGSGTANNNSGSGNGPGTGGSGDGNGVGNTTTNSNGTTQGSNSGYNNNYDSGISDQVVDQIINATKNTSVIRVTPGIDTITIDYVVYDPNNEYQSVYIEVENSTNSQTNIVYLSKTDTKIVVSNLSPNIYYNLNFKYSYKENNSLKEYTFDKTGVYTKMPNMNITVPKILNNKIYYKITLDSNYTITGGTVNLLQNGKIVGSSSISAKGNVNEISGNDCYFDISNLGLSKTDDSYNIITLKIVSLSFNTYTINPGTTYKFKY